MAIPHETKSTDPTAVLWQARIPAEIDLFFRRLCLSPGYKQALVERLVLKLHEEAKTAGLETLNPENETKLVELTTYVPSKPKVTKPKTK